MGEKYCLFSPPSLSSASPSPDPSLLGGRRSSGDDSNKFQIKATQPLSVSSAGFKHLRVAVRARLHLGLPAWFWIQLHQTAHWKHFPGASDGAKSKDKIADCESFLTENSSSSQVTQKTAAPRTLGRVYPAEKAWDRSKAGQSCLGLEVAHQSCKVSIPSSECVR